MSFEKLIREANAMLAKRRAMPKALRARVTAAFPSVVPPHEGNAKCTHCGEYHSRGVHASHGPGSFLRVHPTLAKRRAKAGKAGAKRAKASTTAKASTPAKASKAEFLARMAAGRAKAAAKRAKARKVDAPKSKPRKGRK